MNLDYCINYAYTEFLICLYGFISILLGIIIGILIKTRHR